MTGKAEPSSILAGHMPVRGSDADFGLVIETIRRRHPHVPVYVFGMSASALLRQSDETDG